MCYQSHGENASTESTKSTKNGKTTKDDKKQAMIRQARRTVSLLLENLDKERVTSPTRDSGNLSKNALKAFSSSEAVSVEKFINSGGLRAILSAVERYSSSIGVVTSGCDTIAFLSMLDKSTAYEIVKTGGIDIIVKAVSEQGKHGCEDSRVSVIKILRNLTQTEENRSDIFKAKGLEAVIDTMKQSSDSSRTLSHASLVLSNLAFGNAEVKKTVGELGGITAIVQGMQKHQDCQAMQARGSLALRNLCYGSDDNQRIAEEDGAAEALLKAIEGFKRDREIVHQSCVALANLSNESIPNRAKIVVAGGANLLVGLMEMYQESLTVHDDAISIIRNISVENSEAQTKVGVNGGVGCIIGALEKFKDGKLAEKACSAIRYLCFLPENREKVGECRGMERLVQVLKNFIGDGGIVENALLAIGNATFENAENKTAVGRCGGIATIIKAIEHHRLSEQLQERGCRVLRNLADGSEINQRLVAENGGINTGVFAMMGYPDCASVQEQACAMLLNIVLCEEYVKRVEQADVKRLAEKAISLHGKHRGVLLQAGTLIDRLNGHDISSVEEERETVGSRNIMRLLTKKISRIPSRAPSRVPSHG